MKKKVLILGAGIGGLSTAVRLLSEGYEVKVFEKERSVGGKINIIETEDFCFDLTASILMTPDIYKEVFKYTGKKYQDYIEFIKLEPFYRVCYSDGSSYDFSTDLTKLVEKLESISKEDSMGYIKFLSDTYKKYLIADKYFLNKSFRYKSDFFNSTTINKAMKIKTFSTSYNYISKYIRNEKLRQFIAYQTLYVGISPYNGPNIYTLVPTISQLYGLWHIKGGMYNYIKALQKLIDELGGAIETNSNVEEILISQGKAVGLKTNKGEEKGDIIVCNADFPYAMKELVTDKIAKGIYTDKKISKMKYSCSTFIIYLGLKKKYKNLSVHNFYINDEFKENIEGIFKGQLPTKPSLYIYCPSRMDEKMAAKSKESLNITVRVPNLYFDKIKWDEKTIKLFRRKIIDTISSIKGLEDIEENIIYESYLTPKDLQDSFNSYYGTAFGLSPTLTQTNYFRPHLKSPNIQNLYFVGSSVHPGAGASIVLISSKLVVEEILKENNSDNY
ncbi:MAG: phytoene desaturase family protein [Clostridiaceae bacterium]